MSEKNRKLLKCISCICAVLAAGLIVFAVLYEQGVITNTHNTSSGQTAEDSEDIIAENGINITGQEFSFTRESGVYPEEFWLGVNVDREVEAVYYTLDGSDPSASETRILMESGVLMRDRSEDENVLSAVDPSKYDSANVKILNKGEDFISTVQVPTKEQVDKCNIIKAVALYPDGTSSGVITGTYFIGDIEDHVEGVSASARNQEQGTLAILSITMEYDDLFDDETGIYVRGNTFYESLAAYTGKITEDTARRLTANYSSRGREWERKTHVELFLSDGTTTSLVLSEDCGIRIQGNYSRSDTQKGFRLYARSEYGSKNFNYPVFGEQCTNEAGEVMDKFKTLTLRNGGNCAFTTKYSDTYWQSLVTDLDCSTKVSRPCVVYLNGEYWGIYVLEEDYSTDYFEDHYDVDKEQVVLYKGDAETYASGYKLDLGDLPEGETDENYYFSELLTFFDTHTDCSNDEDYEAFCELVDPQSVMDYFAVELWINNKWDWPGKNWSMWRVAGTDETNPGTDKTNQTDEDNAYADGRWRFCFYDMEFGGVSGSSDAGTNTVKEDNYKTYGMLDRDTSNPAVLCFVYCMSNKNFRDAFIEELEGLSETNFEKQKALDRLEYYQWVYTPLYDQFFARFDGLGSSENSNNGGYASAKCIRDFLNKRADNIQKQVTWIRNYYGEL